MSGQQPQIVQAQAIDLGSFLRPSLTEVVQTTVIQHLREQEAKSEEVDDARLAGDIQNALDAKVLESLGVDSAFWNTLHRDASVKDKFAALALTRENVQPMQDFALEQYQTAGQEIARSIKSAFPAALNTPTSENYWKKRQSAIQTMVESQLKANDTLSLAQCNQRLDDILEDAGVKDAAEKEEAKKALFNAVAKRRAALEAQSDQLSQFDRQKQKAADEEKSKPQAQQQQQQAEQSGSDFDKWMRQRDYQGQNLVVSMVLALILSKGPLNIIDYIGCILTGGADGLLRKWKMLEYQGMTFHHKLASEEFNPLDSGADAPRAQASPVDEQGGATAAQNAAAQQANAGNAAAQAANRPKPQGQ